MRNIWLVRYFVDLDDGQILDLSYRLSSQILKEARVVVGDILVFVKEEGNLWYGVGVMEVRSVIVSSLREVNEEGWFRLRDWSRELRLDWYGIEEGRYIGGWDRVFRWWNWVKLEDGVVEVVSFCGEFRKMSVKLGFAVRNLKRIRDRLSGNQLILLGDAVEISDMEFKMLKKLAVQYLRVGEEKERLKINQN